MKGKIKSILTSLALGRLSQFKISIPIKGLRDVIIEPNSEFVVDQSKFHFRGTELVGTVTIYSPDEQDALQETIYLIEKSLAKICFAYNTEALVERNGYY